MRRNRARFGESARDDARRARGRRRGRRALVAVPADRDRVARLRAARLPVELHDRVRGLVPVRLRRAVRRPQRALPDHGLDVGLEDRARDPRRPVHPRRDLGVRAPAQRVRDARGADRDLPAHQGDLRPHGRVRDEGSVRAVVAAAGRRDHRDPARLLGRRLVQAPGDPAGRLRRDHGALPGITELSSPSSSRACAGASRSPDRVSRTSSLARSRTGTVPESSTKEGRTLPEHKTGTREEWLAKRLELLDAEKEHTRRGDELARAAPRAAVGRDRQGLPLRDRRGPRLARRPLPRAARSS